MGNKLHLMCDDFEITEKLNSKLRDHKIYHNHCDHIVDILLSINNSNPLRIYGVIEEEITGEI